MKLSAYDRSRFLHCVERNIALCRIEEALSCDCKGLKPAGTIKLKAGQRGLPPWRNKRAGAVVGFDAVRHSPQNKKLT